MIMSCVEEPRNRNNLVDFKLITGSDLNYLLLFLKCNGSDFELNGTAFLEIRNNGLDTILVSTYLYQESIFLVSPYSRIRMYENDYLIEGTEPLYPPLIIDTIYPCKNRIYPFSFPSTNNLSDGLFLIEPLVKFKNMKQPKINFPKKLMDIKYPYLIYRVDNKNLIEYTEEFNDIFTKKR